MKPKPNSIILPNDVGEKLIDEMVKLLPAARTSEMTPERIRIGELAELLWAPSAWRTASDGDPYFGFRVNDVVGQGQYRDETIEELFVHRGVPAIRTIILGRPVRSRGREAGDAHQFFPAALMAAFRKTDVAFRKYDPRPYCKHCDTDMELVDGEFRCPFP